MNERPTLGGKLLFPSEFLAAVEFKGQDVHLTIKGVRVDKLMMEGGIENAKPVVTFEETPKKLVLNKTNGKSVARLHGIEVEGWIGKRITLYPTKAKCGREMTDAIRVRDRVPPPKGQAAKPVTQPEAVPNA